MEGLDPRPFHFKKFSIYHHPQVMKVSTDSVILGCWANLKSDDVILDVGCGNGLLSLMAAQRNSRAEITGIDIQPIAIQLAHYNKRHSSFNDRIQLMCADIQQYTTDIKFDHIVCNPPYFANVSTPKDKNRSTYRHSNQDFLRDLILKCKELLSIKGKLSIILPVHNSNVFKGMVQDLSLYIHSCLRVQHSSDKPASLIAYEIRKSKAVNATPSNSCESLVLYDQQDNRSDEYKKLCADFYL